MCILCGIPVDGEWHAYDMIDCEGCCHDARVCNKCNADRGYSAKTFEHYLIIETRDDEGYSKYLFIVKKDVVPILVKSIICNDQ